MTSPKRRRQIDQRWHRREKYRKGLKSRPEETGASGRPAPTERRAEPDMSEQEKRALLAYNRGLRRGGFGEMDLDELRKWNRVPGANKEVIRRDFGDRGESEAAIRASRTTGLPVDRIREIATS